MPRVINLEAFALNPEGQKEVTKRIMVREKLLLTMKEKEEGVAEEQ